MYSKAAADRIEEIKKQIAEERKKYDEAIKEDRPFAKTKPIFTTIKSLEEELRLLLMQQSKNSA